MSAAITQAGPPMIYLPSNCRPAEACSRDDARPARPALRHGFLVQRDDGWWLCATDAYIAVAIKVTTTGEGLQEGWVPRQILKLMRTAQRAEQISTTGWTVNYGPTKTTVEIRDLGTFPDLAKLGLWGTDEEVPVSHIGFDPGLSLRLQRAMFSDGLVGVRLAFTKYKLKDREHSPMRMTGGKHHPDRVGLQMPVRLDV